MQNVTVIWSLHCYIQSIVVSSIAISGFHCNATDLGDYLICRVTFQGIVGNKLLSTGGGHSKKNVRRFVLL